MKYWAASYCPGVKGAISYFGVKTHFPIGSRLVRRVCLHGVYERANVQVVKDLLPRGGVYFDVGANIGLMAIPMLKADPNCTVVSFEPSPNTLPYLEKTRDGSSMTDRWTVIGEALSDSNGTADFHINAAADGAFDGLRATNRLGPQSSVRVGATTLDTVWNELGQPEVSLIKVDVEGGELAVLNGATQCIEKNRPHILLEWSKENLGLLGDEVSDILGFASNLDYLIFTARTRTPINNATELSLHMNWTEDFLMVAKVQPCAKYVAAAG